MPDPIVADTSGLDRLSFALKASDGAAYTGARKALRLAAVPILERAKANAGYSTRIPGSGRIVVSHGLVVRVVFGGSAAPNAAPIENDHRGNVRHPTYSPRPNVPEKVGWTSKNSHPAFLAPAADAEAQVVAETVGGVVAKAVEDTLGSL